MQEDVVSLANPRTGLQGIELCCTSMRVMSLTCVGIDFFVGSFTLRHAVAFGYI